MAETPDYTDDWMNPKPIKWERPEIKYPRFYIEREYRIEGPLTGWRAYADFDTKPERDKALQTLQREHPSWHLRPRDQFSAETWIAT